MPLSLYRSLLDQLNRPVDSDHASLVQDAADVWNRPGFDTFLSVPRLGFEPFDYQVAAAKTVLRRMRGRAILADEVGLGKTIEAGLVLSELRARGMAARSLVVTPAGLVGQWCEELGRKFGLPTTVATGKGWDDDGSVVVASLAAGRRDPLRSELTAKPWDIVIIDEAHRVRGARSASGKLARELRGRHYLLLTATPVENKLQDLYELISIVSPGLLGTAAQFKTRHGGGDTPRNPAELRARTREVMVRHRRSEVAVLLPQRLAETALITPAEQEAAFYSALLRPLLPNINEPGRRFHPHWMIIRGLGRGTRDLAVPRGLDPVERLIWKHSLPNCGLPLVLRMLTAWNRIPDQPAVLRSHPPKAIAAAIDRMIGYRAGDRGHYSEVAGLYHIDEDVIRTADKTLARRLKLSATQLW